MTTCTNYTYHNRQTADPLSGDHCTRLLRQDSSIVWHLLSYASAMIVASGLIRLGNERSSCEPAWFETNNVCISCARRLIVGHGPADTG